MPLFYSEFEAATSRPEVVVMTSGPLFLRLGVPSGMEDLLEGLAREVLRHQPRDIYRFAAVHFQGLLLQREALIKSNHEAQNAALSPSSTQHEGLNNGTELTTEKQPVSPPVTTKSPAPQPPKSQASDSGAASATSSPPVTPSRSPGPQTVRAKLTTTANRHPSPVFQQAIKTAFNAETLLSDRASRSPDLRRTTSPSSPDTSSAVEKKSENSNQNKSSPSPVSHSTVTSPVENTEAKKSESVSISPAGSDKKESESPESNIDKITVSEPNENVSSPVELARSSEPSSPRQKEDGDGSEEKESTERDEIKSPSDENKEDIGERCVSGASQNEIQTNENIEDKITETSRAESKNEIKSPEPEKQDEKSETPVAEPLVAAATSSAETQSELKEENQEEREIVEQSASTLTKRASELGSEDFKPQTPDIIAQSPDQSTYDDVSAAVLVEDETVPSSRVDISEVHEEAETSEAQDEVIISTAQVTSESPMPAQEEKIEGEEIKVAEQEITEIELENEIKSEVQAVSPVEIEEEKNIELEKTEIISPEENKNIDTPAPEEPAESTENVDEKEEGDNNNKFITPTPPPSPVQTPIKDAAGSQAGSRMSSVDGIDEASGELEKIKKSVAELAKLEGESEDMADEENKEEHVVIAEVETAPEDVQEEIKNTETQQEVPTSENPEEGEGEAENNNENVGQVEISEIIEASENVVEESKEIITEAVELIGETEQEIKNEVEKLEENLRVALNSPSETGELLGNIIESHSHQNEDANVSCPTDEEKFAPTAPEESPDKEVLAPSACSNLSVLCECTNEVEARDAGKAVPAQGDAEVANNETVKSEEKIITEDVMKDTENENEIDLNDNKNDHIEAIEEISESKVAQAVETAVEQLYEEIASPTPEGDINKETSNEVELNKEISTEEILKIESPIPTEGDLNKENNSPNEGDLNQTSPIPTEEVVTSPTPVEGDLNKEILNEDIKIMTPTPNEENLKITSATPTEEILKIASPIEGDLNRTLSIETPQETGEILALQSSTEQETVVQILQEDATPSDSQSSLVGNEGLGAVTGVVIRYSISETNENAEKEEGINEETDKHEDETSAVIEKEIAETIIAAVRDSEDTPTETGSISGGDAAQPSISEPAEVISAQTSSSKDAASLELDDVEKEAVTVEPIDLSTFDESDKVQCVVLSEQDTTNDKAGEITLESPLFPIEDINIDTAVQQEMVESPSSGEQIPKESVPEKIILEERKIADKVLSFADRELEEAATRIQSSFRGYHTRKTMDMMQEAQNTVVPAVVARVLDDSDEEAETSTNQEEEIADTSRVLTELDDIKEEIENEQKQLVESIPSTSQEEVEKQISEIKKSANDEILENREQISEAVNEIIDKAVAVTETVQEMVTTEVPVEIVSSGLVAGIAAAAVTSIDDTSPPQVWHAVPAQVFEDEEALLSETEAKLEASRARIEEPSALVELLQNSTLVAATPLAYLDPSPVTINHENNSTLDLIQNSALIATTPLAFTADSSTPPSVSHHFHNTYSSSGENADVSASMTEPISWNGHESRIVDQESGELITADEDDSVWATLEKELGETEELNEAATKIQAGFRGHKTRQSLLHREDAVMSTSGETPLSGVRHNIGDSLPLLPQSGDYPNEDAVASTNFTRLENAADDENMTSSGSESFLDKAATKIQSTFRGFKTRSDLKKEKSPVRNSDIEAATKIQAGFRGYKVRKDMKQDKLPRIQSAPQICVHNTIEDESATKIQAGVRGYLTRQRLKKERSPQPTPSPPSPEVQDAVVKIQAGFRGYKARQEVKTMKEGKPT